MGFTSIAVQHPLLGLRDDSSHEGHDRAHARLQPGGFVDGSGDMRYAQTMAFTTLMLFQIVNVVNARSDERSAFVHLFTNYWLWVAVGLSLVLQVAVVYVPVLQRAFGTVALGAVDWLRCAAVASLVLWLRELGKIVARGPHRVLGFDEASRNRPRCGVRLQADRHCFSVSTGHVARLTT